MIENVFEALAATGDVSHGSEVALEGSNGNFIFLGDGPGSKPFEVFAVDRFPVGVVADLAFATVAFKRREGGGVGCVGSQGAVGAVSWFFRGWGWGWGFGLGLCG